jgi:hypothetical protein
MLLDIPAKPCRFLPATFDESRIAMQLCNVRELHEHVMEEKPQPNAFAFTLRAHFVHAVVPVPGAHERQAVSAKTQAPLYCPHAMLVERRSFVGPAG